MRLSPIKKINKTTNWVRRKATKICEFSSKASTKANSDECVVWKCYKDRTFPSIILLVTYNVKLCSIRANNKKNRTKKMNEYWFQTWESLLINTKTKNTFYCFMRTRFIPCTQFCLTVTIKNKQFFSPGIRTVC